MGTNPKRQSEKLDTLLKVEASFMLFSNIYLIRLRKHSLYTKWPWVILKQLDSSPSIDLIG